MLTFLSCLLNFSPWLFLSLWYIILTLNHLQINCEHDLRHFWHTEMFSVDVVSSTGCRFMIPVFVSKLRNVFWWHWGTGLCRSQGSASISIPTHLSFLLYLDTGVTGEGQRLSQHTPFMHQPRSLRGQRGKPHRAGRPPVPPEKGRTATPRSVDGPPWQGTCPRSQMHFCFLPHVAPGTRSSASLCTLVASLLWKDIWRLISRYSRFLFPQLWPKIRCGFGFHRALFIHNNVATNSFGGRKIPACPNS